MDISFSTMVKFLKSLSRSNNMIKRNNRKNILEMINRRHLMKKEAFKPTDNLSPSETAAVVSNWSHSSWSDSFKDTYSDGERFIGDIRDTLAPMEVFIDKKNRVISVYFLSLSSSDIDDLVKVGLDSNLDADDAFIDVVCSNMRDSFDNEHAMDYKEVEMPVTQVELEKLLDDCESKAIDSYNRLESAFYNAVEGVMESKRNSKRKPLKEARMGSLEDDYPNIKDMVSFLNDNDKWALDRVLFALDYYVPQLKSSNERDVVRALKAIFDEADDMIRLKKRFRKNTFGNEMW